MGLKCTTLRGRTYISTFILLLSASGSIGTPGSGRFLVESSDQDPIAPPVLPALLQAFKNVTGSVLIGRTASYMQAHESHRLLNAIETGSIGQVRSELEAETSDTWDAVLTAPSLVAEHGLHTPLMAAVMRGDLPIFTALLRRFERRFSKKVGAARTSVVACVPCRPRYCCRILQCSKALYMCRFCFARQVFAHDRTALSARVWLLATYGGGGVAGVAGYP